MTEPYQLQQFTTRVGYTPETVDGEDVFDPASASHVAASNRIRWPGMVISVPSVREDYGHKDYQPQGSDPDPNTIQQTQAYYEGELESLLNAYSFNEDGGGLHDLFGLAYGEVRFTLAHGGESGGSFAVGDVITGGTSGAIGTIRARTASDVTVFITSIWPTILFADGEVITAGAVTATLSLGGGNGDSFIEWKRPQQTFTVEYGWQDPNDPTSAGTSHIWRMRGCKISEITFTARANDQLMIRIKYYARFRDEQNTEEPGGGGTPLSGLIEHTNPGLHWKDILIVLTDSIGVIPEMDADILEFDLVTTNNIKQVPGNNQMFEVAKLIESKRRATYSLKWTKRNNRLLDVSRARPGQAAGQIRIQLTFNQSDTTPIGPYLGFDFLVADVVDGDAPTGQDVDEIEESFGGTVIGRPAVLEFERP